MSVRLMVAMVVEPVVLWALPRITEFATSLANLDLAATQPAMHQMLQRLSLHLSNLSLAQDNLASQQKILMAAERKVKVEEAVRGLTNHMSVRALRHNYKILHMVEDMSEVFAPNGVSMIPTDLAL